MLNIPAYAMFDAALLGVSFDAELHLVKSDAAAYYRNYECFHISHNIFQNLTPLQQILKLTDCYLKPLFT